MQSRKYSYLNEEEKQVKIKYIYNIINDLTEIYFKTKDEAYNPDDFTIIEYFVRMNEQERNQKFMEALSTNNKNKNY